MNISTSGVLLDTADRLRPGRRITLLIRRSEDTARVEAEVVRSQLVRVGNEMMYRVALTFGQPLELRPLMPEPETINVDGTTPSNEMTAEQFLAAPAAESHDHIEDHDDVPAVVTLRRVAMMPTPPAAPPGSFAGNDW